MAIKEFKKPIITKLFYVLLGVVIGYILTNLQIVASAFQKIYSFSFNSHTYHLADMFVGWLFGVCSVFILSMILSRVFPNDRNIGNSGDDEHDEEGEEEVVLDDQNLTNTEVEALDDAGIKPVVWVADTGVIWVAEVADDVRDRLHTRILTDFSGKGMRKQ